MLVKVACLKIQIQEDNPLGDRIKVEHADQPKTKSNKQG